MGTGPRPGLVEAANQLLASSQIRNHLPDVVIRPRPILIRFRLRLRKGAEHLRPVGVPHSYLEYLMLQQKALRLVHAPPTYQRVGVRPASERSRRLGRAERRIPRCRQAVAVAGCAHVLIAASGGSDVSASGGLCPLVIPSVMRDVVGSPPRLDGCGPLTPSLSGDTQERSRKESVRS